MKVKNYTEEVISVNYQKYEISGEFPYPLFQEICHLGVFELLKQENNNDDLTFFECIRIIASGFPALASIVLTQGSYIIYPLLQFGNHEQQNKFLKDLMTGHKIGGLALSEQSAGSDVELIETVALETQNSWILNGQKQFISNGAIANFYFVAANAQMLDGSVESGLFIVERQSEGLSVVPAPEKTGLNSLPLCGLELTKVKIPQTALLGEKPGGNNEIEKIYNHLKLAISMQAIGISQSAFQLGLQELQIFRSFGKRLIDDRATRHRMAELQSKIKAVQVLAQDIICKHSQDTSQVAMLKLFASELAVETTQSIIQLLGGQMMTENSNFERFACDADLTLLYGCSAETQKEIIAEEFM
ncbi:acyl-CoA dehydrogenase family protein [Facklamia sp. DSM 111018]|uniref:Acyl-CoA dehydrogenase family protein n=2 Tax=Facklamia lactis TaxID=2749967 RepID=A0ABS0LQ77_9LACT|nr:acyl-CoA dehydrogenase family protein [Facklamia lactis]